LVTRFTTGPNVPTGITQNRRPRIPSHQTTMSNNKPPSTEDDRKPRPEAGPW